MRESWKPWLPNHCMRFLYPVLVVRWNNGALAICGLGRTYHSSIKKRWSDVEHWTVSTSLKSSWNCVEISTKLNVQRKFNHRLVLTMVEKLLKSGWVELQRWFNVETRLNLQRCKCDTLKISWKMVELNFQRWFNGVSTLKVELCLLGQAVICYRNCLMMYLQHILSRG